MHQWSIREAKDQLSALLQAARLQPQVITNRGSASYVVLTHEDYERLSLQSKTSLVDFFASSGLDEVEFDRIRGGEREGPSI